MRIISMHIMKWDPENPFFLSSAYELGFVSWYQRPFFKETLNFGVRTITARVEKGQRTAVKLDDAKAVCYVCVDSNNIACVVVCDEEYPEKVPMIIIAEMFREFFKLYTPLQITEYKTDVNLKYERLEQMIKEYQDYTKADKLALLENNLKEVTDISHKIMSDLMRKGEQLDELMKKSKDMSNVSVDFYKKAKKANSRCCILF